MHFVLSGSKVRSKRLIVLTDMGCEASDDKLEMVMDAIKRDQVEFTFLLPDWDDVDENGNNDGNLPHEKGKNLKEEEGNLELEEGNAVLQNLFETENKEVVNNCSAETENNEREIVSNS